MTINYGAGVSYLRSALISALRAVLRRKIEAAVVERHSPYASVFHELAEHYDVRGDSVAAQQALWQHWLFMLHPMRRSARPPGRARFGGMLGYKDGSEFPDAQAFPPEALAFFAAECAAASHPILRARYADFLYEYGGGRHEFARQALAAYLVAVPHHLSRCRDFCLGDALDRAAELAMKLGDDRLINEAKEVALTTARTLLDTRDDDRAADARDALRTLQSFDLGRRRARLTDAERAEVAVLADGAASYYSARNEYELERQFLKIVRTAYLKFNRPAAVRDIERRIAESYEADAASRVRHLDRLYGLEQAYRHYLACGDRGKADEMKRRRQEAALKGEAEMGVVSMSFEFPTPRMQRVVDHLVALGVPDALVAMSVSELCVPNVDSAIAYAADERERLPLLSAMPWLTLNKGRVTQVAGTESEREKVSELHAYHFSRMAGHALLHLILTRLRREKGLDAAAVTAFLRTGEVFDAATLDTVAVGVERYFAGDYVSAIHVLVPQLEDALRRILSQVGLPTQVQEEDGTTREMALGEVLANPLLKTGLGKDVWYYFRTLLVAQEADNLRNDVAHGIVKASDCTEEIAEAVLHCYLLLVPFRLQRTSTDAEHQPSGSDGNPPGENLGAAE